MPLLSESDAIQVRDTFDLLGESERPLAKQFLTRYADQQAEFGAPLYPTEEATAKESRDAFRAQFAGLDKVAAEVSPYSDDPDRDKAIQINIPFLAERFGISKQEVADRPDFYRGEYARQKFGAPADIDDKAFYQLAAKEINDGVAREKIANEGATEGMRAALAGQGALDAMPGLAQEAMDSPENEPRHEAFFKAYTQTGEILAKHRGTMATLLDAGERSMLGKTKDGDEAALTAGRDALIAMPGQERRIVLAAMQIEGQKRGEKNGADKGGKYSFGLLFSEFINGGRFWPQAGEAASRLLSSGVQGMSDADTMRLLDAVPSSGNARAAGPIATMADAERFVSDYLNYERGQMFANQSDNPAPAGQPGEDVTLTAEQTALIVKAKDKLERSMRVSRELDAIGSAIDPVPNVFASTIGTSAALVGVMAASRGMATPMIAGLYKGVEYNELSLKYPQMSEADKTLISATSAAVQTAGDFIGFSALSKMPGLKSLIAGGWKSELVKRAGLRAAGVYAVENAVEAGQDAATPLLMRALASDVPGYDWEQEKADFWKGRSDVAMGMLPLTLLGIGASTVQEYRGAKELLSWSDKLGSVGVVEADRIAISEAAQAGKTDAATALLREAWGRRSPEVAAEFQTGMTASEVETQNATAEMVRRGMLPDIRRDGSGYVVTADGKSATFSTWEQARDVASQHMNEREIQQADLVASMADSLNLGAGESIDINQRGETMGQRVASGVTTPEDALEAAVAAGILKGMDVAGARSIAQAVFGGESADERSAEIRKAVESIVVLGSNRVTDGKSNSTVSLQGNASPFLTVVEETVEGRWKSGVAEKRFTKAQGVSWVKMAEAATGESFTEGMTHEQILASVEDSPRALTEAISRIVVADVLGRMQSGQRIAPGSISRGLDRTNREQSALAAILDAFREFFKAVLDAATKLMRAREDGTLGADYDALFDALTGGEGQHLHEQAALKEQADFIDTSGYSEDTPGPNGETFSLAEDERADSYIDAFNKVLASGEGASASIEVPGVGEVSIEWGVPGDAKRAFKRGYGLSHIIARRALIEGKDAASWLRQLALTLSTGERSEPYGAPGNPRVNIQLGGQQAVVSLERFGKDEKWLLSAYDLKEIAAGETGGNVHPFSPTHASPSFTHADVVAVAAISIPRISGESTYSLRSADFAARMEAAMSPFNASPEARRAMGKVALERVQRVGAEWIVKAAKLRGSKSINKEAAMREAKGYEERVAAYLDSLSEGARQALEWEPSKLADEPLIAAMLGDVGKLMSRSKALELGKFDLKSGDYDGAPWLPPSFYSKDAGLAPDKMAQALYDLGMLPDAYTDTLWSALAASIASVRKDRGAYSEASRAYSAAKRAARADSKAEAEAWANQERQKAGSNKAQRDMLKGGLRTLDALLSAFPPEVRVKVGGYVKLAGLATDEAMLDEIERRIVKLEEEATKWLRKEGLETIELLFKKAAADYTAGKKAKGKIGADEHHILQRAEAASRMTGVQVLGEIANLDARIESGELTTEQEILARVERSMIELAGNLFPRSMDSGAVSKAGRPVMVRGYPGADVGRLYSAIDAVRDLMAYGAWSQKQAEIAKRERWTAMREALIEDTGKEGSEVERREAAERMKTLVGKSRAALMELSSFNELLTHAFGSGSAYATAFVDAERDASNDYEDEIQEFSDELDALFTRLAGGKVLDGERLRFDMSQPSITAGTSKLSQLEAIQALLMWRQEDGRRHMEGNFDENGKLTSSWGYDQSWIDTVTNGLTSEGLEVFDWIARTYSVEHAEINPLYRRRNGVNMPKHDNYAPITVTPMQAKASDTVNPLTGAPMNGGILSPGSLRTRSTTAVAEPKFRNAVATIIAHKKMMGYWKHYYDVALEANAILGNREVANAVEAKIGAEGVLVLSRRLSALAMGGVRDASAGLSLTEGIRSMTNRAATIGLLGRVSTLLVQSTQLAASSVKMPVGAYLSRFGKLMTGNLAWGDAIRSEFIQRRIKSAPPIVRQAMQNLASAKRPNEITRMVRRLGETLSNADGLFTAGTYAILLDYHRTTGAKLGLSGAELEAHATAEATRETEQVAQPTRDANRSFRELAATDPLAKIAWAYASEARQKLALFAWAALDAKAKPDYAAKVAFLTFGVGGLLTQIIKNSWRELGGDDDEKKWSPERLVTSMLTSPLHGVPVVGSLLGDGNMLSGFSRAGSSWERITSLDYDDPVQVMRDVDVMLSAAGLFNDNLAGLSAASHVGLDLLRLLKNAFGD